MAVRRGVSDGRINARLYRRSMLRSAIHLLVFLPVLTRSQTLCPDTLCIDADTGTCGPCQQTAINPYPMVAMEENTLYDSLDACYASCGAECTSPNVCKCYFQDMSKTKAYSKCSLCSPGSYVLDNSGAACVPCAAGTFNNVSSWFPMKYTWGGGTQVFTGVFYYGFPVYYAGNLYVWWWDHVWISYSTSWGGNGGWGGPGSSGVYGGGEWPPIQVLIAASTDVTRCLTCPAGTYTNGAGASACIACPSGSFSTAIGATSGATCQSCGSSYDISYWLTPAGRTACVSCAPGQYANHVDQKCYPCEAGSYQPIIPSSWAPARFSISKTTSPGCCDAIYDVTSTRYWGMPMYRAEEPGPCEYLWWTNYWFKGFRAYTESNYIDPATGQEYACTMNIGYTIEGMHPTIVTFLLTRATILSKCPACPVGTYMPTTGATACTPCAAGTFNTIIGATAACAACPTGLYANATGLTLCTQCPHGTYADRASGASLCMQCPAGAFSIAAGTTSCVPCAKGAYTSITSQTACLFCASGTYANTTNTTACTPCPAGTYAHLTGATACSPCPDDTGSYPGSSTCVSCV